MIRNRLKILLAERNLNYTRLSEMTGISVNDATKIMFPERINLAFEVLEEKIYRQFPGSDYLGYGLKMFP